MIKCKMVSLYKTRLSLSYILVLACLALAEALLNITIRKLVGSVDKR
jgi:hypothetical protein